MMLINDKLSINSGKFSQEDKILILTGADWEYYEKLDAPEYNSYLISFLNGEITIVSPGRNHERIADMIRDIITGYCRKFNIRYYTFNSTRLKEEGKEGKEPDVAYAFNSDKTKPDLAVEVNFSSGSLNDLTKYQYLKIEEVWIWQHKEIKFYLLQENKYVEIDESVTLKGIKSSILINYINRSFKESPLDIEREFFKEFKQ
ncbi:MAG: Uma2 family endonuclease [Xenococcaceae cyanobacterium MO_188.B29]|nr:Uma2 family endonuclease [Xenococcaceae cyanobacterium MO_188.B29]